VNQLVSRWQVLLPNLPDSYPSGTPSVINGRVYAASSTDMVLDALTGTPLWSTTLSQGRSCLGVSIGATPAISGSTVVLGGGMDVEGAAYYGYNADGTLLCGAPLDVAPSGFPGESPLIDGNRVYLGLSAECDNPSVRGELRMVDLPTGATLARQYFLDPGEQ